MARKNYSKTNNIPKTTADNGAAPAALPDHVFVVSHLNRGIVFDMPDGSNVRISGINDHLRGKEKGILAVGGGVYTKVKADAWEYIAKTFKDFQAIKNGLLYAVNNPGSAKAAIKERKELRNGFEPVDTSATKSKADSAGE